MISTGEATAAAGGYALSMRRLKSNASYAVPLLLYLQKACETVNFRHLGQNYNFPFLFRYHHTTTGPKHLRRPVVRVVPTIVDGFIPFPPCTVARILAEAATRMTAACTVSVRCVAWQRVTAAQVAGVPLPEVLADKAVVALCKFVAKPHPDATMSNEEARAVTKPLFRHRGALRVARCGVVQCC
jgi:hypothetical protein